MNSALLHRRILSLSALLLLTAPVLAQKTERNSSKPGTAAAAAPAASLSPALSTLFQKTRPATVQIRDCAPVESDPDCSDPNGLGSGVLISADGSLLTAYHVVYGSARLEAVTLDKKHYKISVVGFDEPHDLALLKINISGAAFVPLAAQTPRIGQAALAIGNAGGAFLQPKTGKLLALNAAAGRADFPPGTLQLDAPLAPGDSGGPILNDAGQLIGITSYIRQEPGEKTQSLPSSATYNMFLATLKTTSYAVPVSSGSDLLAQLRSGIKREAPVVGVDASGVPTDGIPVEVLAQLGLGKKAGFVFTGVTAGGPAALAGLHPLKATTFDAQGAPTHATGDVITAVDGQDVVSYPDFLAAIRSHEVGDQVTLTVIRDGAAKPLSIKIKLAPRTILVGQTAP